MDPAPNLLDLICPAPHRVRLHVSSFGVIVAVEGEVLYVWSDPSNSIMPKSNPPENHPQDSQSGLVSSGE